MHSPALTRTLFFAGMALASAAFAGADVNKCVTPSGQVTLTDAVCPDGTETIKVISGPDSGAAAPASSGERYTVARIPARHAALMRTQPARGLALDVATLKMARAQLQVFDTASQALRSQRLASLQ